MTKVHNFEDKLEIGEAAEKVLDKFLEKRFDDITPVNMNWQRRGVDRWVMLNGYWIPIEYKADFVAARTGNAYLETKIFTENGKEKPGWAKTTVSQILYYYVPPLGIIYPVYPVLWKTQPDLLTEYKTAKARNNGYSSEGILIPLMEFSLLYGIGEIYKGQVFKDEKDLLDVKL